MNLQTIENAHVVTPGQVLRNCDILIENGKILEVGEEIGASGINPVRHNAEGLYALPGIIDLHTDALEKEITPRPRADFPVNIALQELEARLLSCGITTVFHSLNLGYQHSEANSRSKISREEVFYGVKNFAETRSMINTRLHLRFEITGLYALNLLHEFINMGIVDLLSFMDHTPGQGQYSAERFFQQLEKKGLSLKEAKEELRREQEIPKLSETQIAEIVKEAKKQGIPVASHDDDSADKVRRMRDLGIEICEFPINLEAAQTAKDLGMHTLGGSSNALRGGSLTGNLCMTEAVEKRVLDGFCSDYYPPSILHAVFKLWLMGKLALHEAVNMASSNPAKAAGINHFTGSIEAGKDADIILIRLIDGCPKVERVFSRGQLAHQASWRETKDKRNTIAAPLVEASAF